MNFASLIRFVIVTTVVLFMGVKGQDQPGAIWMPSPFYMSRNGQTVKWLILHGTAGGSSARGVGTWFQNPSAQASTHYIVDQGGTVVQSVREDRAAWANGGIERGADPWWAGTGNPNYPTISIEHVKSSTDNSNVLTAAQKTASFNLIRDIIRRNPRILKRRADASGGITGHYSMQPISRSRCPGPYPWEELFSFLNGGHNNGGGDQCYGTVTSNVGLRIRAQANTSSAVVGNLNYNERAQLSGRVVGENVEGRNTWFKVGRGYASGRYLQLSSGGPSWCQ